MNAPTVTCFCHACGNGIDSRAEICPKCGVRQRAALGLSATAANGKSRIAAALFAFFLGAFGVHKFYLGKTLQGLLYLLFCWTLIPSIAALIEFIILLTMSDAKFAQKYGGAAGIPADSTA